MSHKKYLLNSSCFNLSHSVKLNFKKAILSSLSNSNSNFGVSPISGSLNCREIIFESKMNLDSRINTNQDPNNFQNTPTMNRISTQKNRSSFKNLMSNGFARFVAVATFMLLSIHGFGQAPSVTSISPLSGIVGTDITISGTNFDSTASNNIVYFGGIKAIVSSATSTELVVSVPNNAAVGNISVTNLATALTKTTDLKFNVTWPESTSISSASSSFIQSQFSTSSTDANYDDYPQPITSIGDYDGDGKIDIAKANGAIGNGADVFLNTSTGTRNIGMSSAYNLSLTGTYESIINGDFDNDGKIDLLVGSTSANPGLVIWKNTSTTGSLSFINSNLTLTSNITVKSIEVGDVNGDGLTDILYVNSNATNVYMLQNTTSGQTISFSNPITSVALSSIKGIDVGDVDYDGDLDIIVVTYSNIKFYINDGSGTFSAGATISYSPPSTSANCSLVDLDNDGDKDLVVSGNSSKFFVNNSGTWSSSNSFSCDGCGFRTLTTADYDGDGDIDVAHGAPYSTARFQLNRNNFIPSNTLTFAGYVQASFSNGRGTISAQVADFDNTGKPDYFTMFPDSDTEMCGCIEEYLLFQVVLIHLQLLNLLLFLVAS